MFQNITHYIAVNTHTGKFDSIIELLISDLFLFELLYLLKLDTAPLKYAKNVPWLRLL